jgi:hypothetical protein
MKPRKAARFALAVLIAATALSAGATRADAQQLKKVRYAEVIRTIF